MAKNFDKSNLAELKKRTAQRTKKTSLEQNLQTLERLLPNSPTSRPKHVPRGPDGSIVEFNMEFNKTLLSASITNTGKRGEPIIVKETFDNTCEQGKPILITNVIGKLNSGWETTRTKEQIVNDIRDVVYEMYKASSPALTTERIQKVEYEIWAITNAYEQGFGYGVTNRTGYSNPYGEFNEQSYAWNIGFTEGQCRFNNNQASELRLNNRLLSFVKFIADLSVTPIPEQDKSLLLENLMLSAKSLIQLHGATVND